MSIKEGAEPITIKEVIEMMDTRIKETESEIIKLLDKIQDNWMKGVVAKLVLLIAQRANQNILRITANIYKIEDLEGADKEIREFIQPILDLIFEDKSKQFIV